MNNEECFITMDFSEIEQRYMALYCGTDTTVYNPNNVDVEELPRIFGFNNGGTPGWWQGVVMSEDGDCLHQNMCVNERDMPAALGVAIDTRPDLHEAFRKYYPQGYIMEFVPYCFVRLHDKLQQAGIRYTLRNTPVDQMH